MTRQEGLKALFKAEIDRMNELMEDLFFAAKATGNHLNPGHLEADVTLPPSFIQFDGDSGGGFGRYGRGY